LEVAHKLDNADKNKRLELQSRQIRRIKADKPGVNCSPYSLDPQ
jgi:hypothetical protein